MIEMPSMAPGKKGAAAEQPKADAKRRETIDAILKGISGSAHEQFGTRLANAVVATAWCPKSSDEDRANTISAVLVGMKAFKPADEIEGMIAAQAVAMHHASMEWSRRAMIPDQGFEPAREYRKAAANASRAFVELLAALDRKRGKGGQQKVTVEHVHVHAGGNAIVGAVGAGAPTGGGGGGGGEGKKLDEPHAPPAALEHDVTLGAVFPPLRSTHPEREPVPLASDAERPLPDARRR